MCFVGLAFATKTVVHDELSAASGLAQVFQKLFSCNQIRGAEALCKPRLDRLKAGDSVGGTAMMTQHTS